MRDCFNIDEMSVKDIDETVHLEEIIFSHPWSKKSIESTISEKKLLNRDIAVVETLFSTGIRI